MSPDELVDFSDVPLRVNIYEGVAEKYTVDIDGCRYLLKFGMVLEPDPKNAMQASYANIPVNEYLGSRIVASMGIPAQEVTLGVHNGRSVVACKDFVYERGPQYQLLQFGKLETSMVGGSSSSSVTPEYEFTMRVLHEHPALEPVRNEAIARFWETIVADALIGNFDRHSGNWGYILDRDTLQVVDVAPVYDCGSALYSRMSEEQMGEYVANVKALEARVRQFPKMKLIVDGRKPSYDEFLVSEKGYHAREALLDLMPRISLERIGDIVDATPGISDTRRAFYKTMTEVRYRVVLMPAYKLALREHPEQGL